jgi:hypothetical protein
MKHRELVSNESVEVGDIILVENMLGKHKHGVHRVTKCYAFVWWNEVAEGKFPRPYREFGYRPVGRDKWSTVSYTVYRPVNPKTPDSRKGEPR